VLGCRARDTLLASTKLMKDSVTVKIKRGSESWNYIYITLGFTLSIEGTVVSIIPQDILEWPLNIVFLFSVFVLTGMFFLRSGWFQNKLINFKSTIEEQFN
jgi:hypothetical protein